MFRLHMLFIYCHLCIYLCTHIYCIALVDERVKIKSARGVLLLPTSAPNFNHSRNNGSDGSWNSDLNKRLAENCRNLLFISACSLSIEIWLERLSTNDGLSLNVTKRTSCDLTRDSKCRHTNELVNPLQRIAGICFPLVFTSCVIVRR